MGKSIDVAQKKRGRPYTGGPEPHMSVRLPQGVIDQVAAWAAKHDVSRSEAFRRLVELGLTVKEEAKPSTAMHRARRGKADHASSMAGTAIDTLSDQSATTEEQAKRKRRLIKGPSEFRDIRDRAVRKRDA
jgi:hypothetical protein